MIKRAISWRNPELFAHIALPDWMRARLHDAGYIFAGNLLKLALGFATSAVIFRELGPSDAGRLTLALGVIGLISIVGEFGLRDAAVTYIARFLPTAPERAYSYGRAFFVARVILGALASAVGILGAGLLAARFYPDARVDDLIRLGAFSLFTSGLLAFGQVILEANKSFALMSRLSIFQAVLRAGLVGALFIAHGINVYALMMLEAVVPLAVFIYSLRLVPRAFYRPDLGITGWRLRTKTTDSLSLSTRLGTLFHFTKWIAVAALAFALVDKLDVLMLSYYRPPVEIGLYGVALALVGRLSVVENAVLTTAFPEACRYSTRAELRAFVVRSLKLTGLASAALLPLFAVGGLLIQVLYGVAYRDAAIPFYVLLAAFIIGLNTQPAAFILYPLNRPRWIAASNVLQLGLNVATNLILIPPFGILGAACAVLITQLGSTVITSAFVRYLLSGAAT